MWNQTIKTVGKISDEIQNSYGAKLDFGYDVTDKFAVFATLGYIEYRYDSSLVSTSVDSFAGVNPESVSTEERTLYGFGIKYSLNESYDLSLAYEYFDNNKSDNFSLERVKANNVAKKYTDVIKIGASYRF